MPTDDKQSCCPYKWEIMDYHALYMTRNCSQQVRVNTNANKSPEFAPLIILKSMSLNLVLNLKLT